jgi:hypothetical protein
LIFVLCLALGACTTSDDTGTAASAVAEGAEKPSKKGRSYSNPESTLTKEEKADILGICTALVECERRACTKGQEQVRLGAINPQSEWGKLMVKHLNAVGRAEGGKRVARLLVQEDLKWASKDCRKVLKTYSNGYQ